MATAGDVGERRAFSEVLANSMYRELGFQAPVSYASEEPVTVVGMLSLRGLDDHANRLA